MTALSNLFLQVKNCNRFLNTPIRLKINQGDLLKMSCSVHEETIPLRFKNAAKRAALCLNKAIRTRFRDI